MVKDWDKVKDQIRVLYKDQNKTLDEVMRLMKGNHDFVASKRSYQTQLRQWGYMKYNTETFQIKRDKNPKNVRRALPTRRERLIDTSTSRVTMASESGTLHRFTSIPTLSGSWDPFSITGATANQISAFDHAQAGIGFTSTSGIESRLDAQDAEGKTGLHHAVISKSEERVKELLTNGAAVDIADNSQNQPLHYAILGGSVTVVELLLKYGADCDCKGQSERSPLHLSLEFPEIMKVILRAQAFPSAQDMNGNTPLHLLLTTRAQLPFHKKDDPIQLLIDAGADVNRANLSGVTPFHLLISLPLQGRIIYPWEEYHNYKYMEVFLHAGADVSLKTRQNRYPFEVFLEISADEWSLGRRGSRSLDRERSPNANSMFKAFIDNGADPNTRLCSGELILHHYLQSDFCRWNKDQTILDFLCRRASPHEIGGNGNYLLHELCANLRHCKETTHLFLKALKTVLERGANPNQLNQHGLSPMIVLLTTPKNSKAMIPGVLEVLLAAGADPMLPNPSGNLPMYEVIQNFPTLALDLGSRILQASISVGGLSEVGTRGACGSLDEDLWFQNWQLALGEDDWTSAKDRLVAPHRYLSPELGKQLHLISLSVLAKKHLESTKNKNIGYDESRRIVSGILRDCRSLELDIDMKWFDYLVDLSLC